MTDPVGRPPLYGEALRKMTVYLSVEHAQILRDLGDGNLSAGIRKAAEQAGDTSPR